MQTNIDEIVTAIACLDLNSIEEANRIIRAVNHAIERMQEDTKSEFTVGMRVSFCSIHTGQRIEGIVTKIMRKNIQVTAGGHWRVSPNLLTQVK